MAAGYEGDQPSPNVTAIPAFHTEQLSTSGSTTISFANVTESVTIIGEKGFMVSINYTSFNAATWFQQLRSDDDNQTPALTIPGQFKSIKILNLDASNTSWISVVAVLSRVPAADFPDITTANGFEKV